MTSKKTKIVATIGPKTEQEKDMEKLVLAGLNVVRSNFSHGTYEEHALRFGNAKKLAAKHNVSIATLQDLSGPKIRIGDFYQERVELKAGSEFTLTAEKITGGETKASFSIPDILPELKKGQIIFLDDGKKKLEVIKPGTQEVKCKILVGGDTKGRRGVNLPGANLSISSLTDKDRRDLVFGIEQKVDYMALSFVRRPEDVLELRRILTKHKAAKIKIVTKIETQEAIDNLDAILAVSDAVMVARGDLAVEVPAEQVPVLQKDIIQKCKKLAIPVITATQMLESMIKNPVPTRAEVNDVANAILDGTDAVMLSEETTLGDYAVEAVATMARIARHTEQYIHHHDIYAEEHLSHKNITDAISHAALSVASDIKARAIVVLSKSGFVARTIARHRPHVPIMVLTTEPITYYQTALNFGCYPVLVPRDFKTIKAVGDHARRIVLESKTAKAGDPIVIVAGMPFGVSGTTNTILAEKV